MLLIVSIAFALVVGCAAGNSQSGYDNEGPMETTTAASPGDSDGGSAPSPDSGSDPQAEIRKIIRNARLDLTAVNVVDAYGNILDYTKSVGGYEAQREQTDRETYTVIYATLRLPPEHLDELIEFVRGQGNLVNFTISSEDITESYYDAQTRLASMEKTLERYYEFLEDSRNIEETLSVQYQIDNLTLEIESLKGKLKLWDSLLAESTVELTIRQVNDPIQIRKEVDWNALTWDDMSYLMTSGLKSVINVLTGIGQWLLIVVVASAPLWIPLLIILVVLIRRRKKKRQKLMQAASLQHVPTFQPVPGTKSEGESRPQNPQPPKQP